MARRLLSQLLCAALLVPSLCFAADFGVRKGALRDQLVLAGQSVENAFSRRMAVLSPETLQQPSALELSDLFPAYGFAPRTVAGQGYTLTGLDENQAALCLKRQVTSVEQWNEALVALSSAGYGPADATCVPTVSYAHAPAVFPAVIAGRKVLDRRNVPTKTLVSQYPAIAGVDAAAVTRPGLVLTAPQGSPGSASAITVFNPFTLVSVGPPPVGLTLSLSAISVREGFDVQHNCSFIFPDGTCSIEVRYDGTRGKAYVGSLLLVFSNGARANIGLLGTTP